MTTAPPKSGLITSTKTGSSQANWAHVLPTGSQLYEFKITGVVGEGGFGIVYEAFDRTLERRVAIKEYMPSSLATRMQGAATVSVKYDHQQETFEAGLRSFVNEARLLAQFDHHALVKVHRFWEANGTAYMVMPFYEGPTLRAALTQLGTPPDEQWLRDLLEPLLDALTLLHDANCFHRDIAPDNILLTPAGPLLLDFGAARRVISAAKQALTVILKPGYAPIEQYGEVASLTQGPWTDIYALCCVVYSAITSKSPQAAMERFMEDHMQPLTQQAAGRYSERFLSAIDAGLAVKPQQRPQDIAQFRELLGDFDAAVLTDENEPRTLMRFPSQQAPLQTKRRTLRHVAKDPQSTHAPTKAKVESRPITASSQSRKAWLIASACVFALVVAGALFVNSKPAPIKQEADAVPRATALLSSASSSSIAVAEVASSVASSIAPVIANQNAAIPTAAVVVTSSSSSAAAPTMKKQSNPSTVAPRAPTSAEDSSATSLTQRCREILQRASLESLTPEDTDFLKRNCK